MVSESLRKTRGLVSAASAEVNKILSAEREAGRDDSRYRGFFQKAPVALWDEDFSSVVELLDEIRHRGITDLREYFRERQGLLRQAIDLVRLNDVNEFTL